MAFPKFWEILFGSSGDKTILPERLPAATSTTKGAVTLGADGGAAKDSEVVKTTAQTLSSTVQEQVLENLGVTDALEDLITEYGGTVPTSINTVSAQSAEAVSVQSADADNASDPWAGLH